MSFRTGFYAGMIVAVIWGLYLARLWQGQRQVELHSVHLLAAVERHDWKTVGEFVGGDYRDQWGNDRALSLERLREVFCALCRIRGSSPRLFLFRPAMVAAPGPPGSQSRVPVRSLILSRTG